MQQLPPRIVRASVSSSWPGVWKNICSVSSLSVSYPRLTSSARAPPVVLPRVMSSSNPRKCQPRIGTATRHLLLRPLHLPTAKDPRHPPRMMHLATASWCRWRNPPGSWLMTPRNAETGVFSLFVLLLWASKPSGLDQPSHRQGIQSPGLLHAAPRSWEASKDDDRRGEGDRKGGLWI